MKIPITDTDRIREAIKAAEGRATARCTSPEGVVRIVAEAEHRLSALPKRLWRGVVVYHLEEGPWARRYNDGRGADATAVSLQRRSRDWVLTEVERQRRWEGGARLCVYLPAAVSKEELHRYLYAASGLQLASTAEQEAA